MNSVPMPFPRPCSYVITGATSGLGEQLVRKLIERRQDARITLGVRNVELARSQVDALAEEFPDADVHGRVTIGPSGTPSSQSSRSAAPSSAPGSPSLDNAMSNTRSVQAGVVEKMYRSFWSRKGDVFHLLLSLAITLDDRVWPKTDERDVQLFISLVHHITGVKMRAYFYSGDEGKSLKVMGRRWKSTPGDGDSDVGSMAYDAFAFGSRVRLFNWMRKFKMIMKAHLSPWNSGTLAAEALVSPFFGPNRSPPHAELPVCVSAAFPFRQGV